MAVGVATKSFDDRGANYYVSPTTAHERLIRDVDNEYHELEPDLAPLTTITSHPSFNSRPAKATKYEWFESERLPSVTTTDSNDDGSGAATSIVVATGTGAYFKANDIIMMESTGEKMKVSSVSTDTLTVVRGLGNSGTGVEWGSTNGLFITRLGNASAQGAGLPAINMAKDVANFNYTQIQRDPWSSTNTSEEVGMYLGSPRTTAKRLKMKEHKLAIDYVSMWGARDIDTSGDFVKTYCGGVVRFLSTNVVAINGALTYVSIENNLRKAFRYGSTRKVGFASPIVFNNIAALGYGKLALDGWKEVEVFGAKARRIVTSSGNELDLVLCREWQDTVGATGAASGTKNRGGSLVILDLDNITARPLRKTRVLENRQANDVDLRTDELLTEFGIQVEHERTHAYYYGIAAAS